MVSEHRPPRLLAHTLKLFQNTVIYNANWDSKKHQWDYQGLWDAWEHQLQHQEQIFSRTKLWRTEATEANRRRSLGGLVSCFSLALTYTASLEPPGLSTVPQGNSKGLWLLPIISARTQQLSSTHILQPKQRHSEGTRNRHTPGTIAKMKKFHLSL